MVFCAYLLRENLGATPSADQPNEASSVRALAARQPAPRIAAVFGDLTWVFGISAGFVFVAGWIFAARRSRQMAPQAQS
jgi:hypothetical protein